MNFNDRLKKAMNLRNISQIELVEKSGIDKSTISGYINGKFNPKIDRTKLFAKILDVNVDWLLGDSDEMEIQSPKVMEKEAIYITQKHRNTLKNRLLDTMIKKGLNQESLSEKSNVPSDIINGYIIGNLEPKLIYIEKLAKALQLVDSIIDALEEKGDGLGK